MIDENYVYIPEYLSDDNNDSTSDSVYVPSFLSEGTDEYGISLTATGDFCGMEGDCPTECSMYGMGSCGEPCTECGQPSTPVNPPVCNPYSMPCNQGDCTIECSEYCMGTMEEIEGGGTGGDGGDCVNGEGSGDGGDCVNGEGGGDCENGEGGEGDGEDDGEITASITVRSVTSDSATLYITVDPDYQYYRIFCRLYDDENDETLDVSGLSRTSNFTYTITGLLPDTYYILNLGVNNTGVPHGTWVYNGDNPTFWTEEDGEFSWTYAGFDSSGNPVRGDDKISGYGIYVTAVEWNEYISFVNDKFGSSLPTVTKNTKISANIVNAAAAVVGAAQTSSGSPITASFFNDLKDAANE